MGNSFTCNNNGPREIRHQIIAISLTLGGERSNAQPKTTQNKLSQSCSLCVYCYSCCHFVFSTFALPTDPAAYLFDYFSRLLDSVLHSDLDFVYFEVLKMRYTLSEYAEMHYFYGVAQGNGREAARMYREQLQRRGGPQPERYPDHRVFINTHNTLMAGRIPGQCSGREGIPRADTDRREMVLEEVQQNPSTSTRSMARALNIPRTSIQEILHDEGYHAFHIRRVQALLPTDNQLRIDFCQTMLRKEQEDPGFFNKVLCWAIENPHEVRASTFQHHFSVNLWSGILNGEFIGPFELPSRLNGETYRNSPPRVREIALIRCLISLGPLLLQVKELPMTPERGSRKIH